MKKYKFIQNKINNIKDPSKSKRNKNFKVKKDYRSNATQKIERLDKSDKIPFIQFKKRILDFLKDHNDFDAGLLQRWVEKRADAIEKKEKSKLHRVRTLFGRGQQVKQSSSNLKMLAKIIEKRRLGDDPIELKKFKKLLLAIKKEEKLDLDETAQFILNSKEHYMKEILDFRDDLKRINTPQALELETRLKKVLVNKEKELLDDLFSGEFLRATAT